MITMTGGGLAIGSGYHHSGSGGPPKGPHVVRRVWNWILGRDSQGAPLPPPRGRWAVLKQWAKAKLAALRTRLKAKS